MSEAESVLKAHDEWLARQATGKGIRTNSILVAILAVYARTSELALTGDPDKDWRAMRRILEEGSCPRLKRLAQEARNLRLIDRGSGGDEYAQG